MPVGDPQAGRVFVWLIVSFILLCLAVGGAFLIMYMSQPDPPTSTWQLYAGMALVCFPWFFWIVLCVYRCISRSLGFRIVCGGGISEGSTARGGGGGGGGSTMGSGMNRAGSLASAPSVNASTGVGSTQNGDGRHVHFGAAIVVNDVSDSNHDPRSLGSRSSSSSSSENNMSSFKSHESEVPLASAMAS